MKLVEAGERKRKKSQSSEFEVFFPVFRFQRRYLLSWCMLIFPFQAILLYAIFYIIWAVEGDQWNAVDVQWAKLKGYLRVQSGRCPLVIYFLVMWSEICSGLSLMFFYYMITRVRCDPMEMDFIISSTENSLTERFLPSKHVFFFLFINRDLVNDMLMFY